MEIPASLSERFPFLDALEEDWEPVSASRCLAGWHFTLCCSEMRCSAATCFNGSIWFSFRSMKAATCSFEFSANGSWWREEHSCNCFVPFALATYFAFRRQMPGTAFCAFFFFEQFLPIAIYMADARTPGVASSDGRRFRRRHSRLVLFVFACGAAAARYANRRYFSHFGLDRYVCDCRLVFLALVCRKREAATVSFEVQINFSPVTSHLVTRHSTGGASMSDLRVNFCGIESPNPFWLASGRRRIPAGQVMRAFEAGWGGAVWKTIGEPIVNTRRDMARSTTTERR